jgi:hypothetical protein
LSCAKVSIRYARYPLSTSRITYRSVGDQATSKMLCMVVYLILRRAIRERCNVCIISIGQDSAVLILESLW